jgi:hypothetical protein
LLITNAFFTPLSSPMAYPSLARLLVYTIDISGTGVEKKKPALGGLCGLLLQIRTSSLFATCGSDTY